MARRYIGDAVVTITYRDHKAPGDYAGTVTANGRTWKFEDLYAPACGHGPGIAYDSPEAYDRMASGAVSFGSYYTSDNRACAGEAGNTDGYPDAETADAIADATCCALTDGGEYEVRRSKDGPVTFPASR